MKSIQNFFLKSRHWQLFIVGFLPFILFYINLIITMPPLFGFDNQKETPDFCPIMEDYVWFGPAMIFLSFILFGWIWAVGVYMQRKLPPFVQFNVKRFKWFIAIPFFYTMLINILITWMINSFIPGIMDGGSVADEQSQYFLIGTLIILPLHLFSIIGIFWSMVFTARVIKSVELQRKARFEDAVAEFFLIWFFIVGLWILQPRVNRIANGMEVFVKKDNSR
jgi:hypothetical protein